MLHGVASLIIMLRAPLQSFFWSFPFLSVSSSVVLESESKVAQSCPTLCNPMDCSLPDSSIHGIFQARVLEWVAISFSRGSSWPSDWTRVSLIAGRRLTIWATRCKTSAVICLIPFQSLVLLSRISLFQSTLLSLFSHSVMSTLATLWTVTCKAPLSMGFPRQEYWIRLPFPSPWDLPDPGTESVSQILCHWGTWDAYYAPIKKKKKSA